MGRNQYRIHEGLRPFIRQRCGSTDNPATYQQSAQGFAAFLHAGVIHRTLISDIFGLWFITILVIGHDAGSHL